MAVEENGNGARFGPLPKGQAVEGDRSICLGLGRWQMVFGVESSPLQYDCFNHLAPTQLWGWCIWLRRSSGGFILGVWPTQEWKKTLTSWKKQLGTWNWRTMLPSAYIYIYLCIYSITYDIIKYNIYIYIYLYTVYIVYHVSSFNFAWHVTDISSHRSILLKITPLNSPTLRHGTYTRPARLNCSDPQCLTPDNSNGSHGTSCPVVARQNQQDTAFFMEKMMRLDEI